MPIEVPGPDLKLHTRCRVFAQWFHEHGIAWSGTPSELASELSKNVQTDEVNQVLLDTDQLFAFLEANAQAMREFGVDVFLRKASGQPRSISLQTIPQPAKITESSPTVNAIVDQQPGIDTFENELALGAPNDGYEELDTLRAKMFQTNKAGLGKKSTPKLVDAAPPLDAVKETGISAKYEPIDSFRTTRLPTFLLLIAILVAGFFIVRSLQNEGGERPATTQSQEPENSKQNSLEEHTPRIEDQTARTKNATIQSESKRVLGAASAKRDLEISTLTREAVEQRKGVSQYELGVRYVQGRGVKTDKVVGYAWLVLARANGDRRSDGTLRALTPQLSLLDLQKVRLMLGDWHARGFGVPTDYVAAHSWFTLAEIAGAAEAKLVKKQLEARMSQRQIQDANTRTTAWLNRH